MKVIIPITMATETTTQTWLLHPSHPSLYLADEASGGSEKGMGMRLLFLK